MSDKEIIRAFYDQNVAMESERLNRHPFEFLITTAMMDKYIQPGDSILDVGGGPGRYSVHYAAKGCAVTLIDLSEGNVRAARKAAKAAGVKIKAKQGDACELDTVVKGQFDHIFLMGPMYHLLAESDRICAMEQALARLKPGGKIYVTFIQLFAGMIYMMKFAPEFVIDPNEFKSLDALLCTDTPFAGDGFTRAIFIPRKLIQRFTESFPIRTLHFFGQESITAPCELNLLSQPQEVREKWLELGLLFCERDEGLTYTEHIMVIAEKLH
mgnify:FL=1